MWSCHLGVGDGDLAVVFGGFVASTSSGAASVCRCAWGLVRPFLSLMYSYSLVVGISTGRLVLCPGLEPDLVFRFVL